MFAKIFDTKCGQLLVYKVDDLDNGGYSLRAVIEAIDDVQGSTLLSYNGRKADRDKSFNETDQDLAERTAQVLTDAVQSIITLDRE